MGGMGRSLGGYGGPTITSYYSNAAGTSPAMANGRMLLPTPSGTMRGSSISGRIVETPIGGVMMGGSTPIGGSSAPGAMARSSRMGSPARLMPAPYGSGGMTGMSPSMGAGMRRSPYGPGLSAPFRPPSSLPGTSTMGMP